MINVKGKQFLILALLSSAPALGDAIIRFEPGPLDGYHLYTPWGDFIAVQDGNILWIGTPEEYERRRVAAISKSEGFREQPGNPNNFILIGLASTSVGRISISAFSSSLMPKSGAKTEVIDVVWLQSSTEHVSFSYIDTTNKLKATNVGCGRVSEFNYCDFKVSDDSFIHPGIAVFTMPGKPPGIIAIDSPAKSVYQSMKISLAPDNSTLPPLDPSPEQQKQLTFLHAIDPSIPASVTP